MCHSGPKWKREKVPDHKFDFVDTRDFTDNGFFMRFKYLFLYILVLKSFLVYMSDIFTAVTMLVTDSWSNQIFDTCAEKKLKGCIAIPFDTAKWLFIGCIIFSFLLLGYESYKAKKIIASRDISYTFTNVMANNYYSIRSYDHFCFFDHISNSTKTSDDFAFFVFFVFKSWKRVLLADGPRQTINALTLYAIYLSKRKENEEWYNPSQYFAGNKEFSTSALTVTTFFTVVIFAGSLLLLLVAGACYIPLLCHIRGNLKEYCCHKVDKRISDVIKRRQKERLAEAAKLAQREAKGDFSHLKNKKGDLIAKPLPQPTLPNLSVDDDDDMSVNHRVPPSTYTYSTQDQYYYDSKNDYPPPMPAYNPYSHHQGSGPQYNSSQASLYEDQAYYSQPNQQLYDDNESTAHLASSAVPFSQYSPASIERPGTTGPGHRQDQYDPHDVYQGRMTTPTGMRQPPPQSATHPYDYSGQAPGSSQSQTLYETSPSAYSGYSNSQQQYPSQPQGRYGGGDGNYVV